MNDTPLDVQNPAPIDPGEWDESGGAPEEVRELFVVLGKALRAYQLYDENNPVYQRFVSALATAFNRVWEHMDRLTVQVTEDALSMSRSEVYRSDSRAESLAFLFFKDGIRELTFSPGIETDELTRFLSVLQRARKARQEGDDLLTILWEEDLRFLRYKYVDLLAEGVEVPEPGTGGTAEELQLILESEVPEEAEAEEAAESGENPDAHKQVSRDDFNPTLYSLDPREMTQLRREVRLELERDLRGDVLSALFDRLEEPHNTERQSEILGVFRQLLPSFLSRGAMAPAGRVLGEIRSLVDAADALDEKRRGEASRILDVMSSRTVVEELIRGLEDGSIRTDPASLGSFLGALQPSALGAILRAAETTEIKEIQPVLRLAVGGIARKHTDEVLRLMDDEDPVVAAGAARLAGRMRLEGAGPILVDLLRHPEAPVRLAAVEAAAEIKASTVAGALQETLDDADRDVRVAAARALGSLRYRPATTLFADLVQSREVKASDLSEKIAFFESYGLLGGDDAVPVLDRMLNGRGFLGRRESSEVRACAALALGKVGTTRARSALEKATMEDDQVVRSAVNRALRGEEE